MDTQKYKFWGALALEYRLSLKNICLLMEKPNTEENRMAIYECIKKTTGGNIDLLNRYKFLFFNETLNESVKASNIAFVCALNFLKRYKKVQEEGNEEKVKEMSSELFATETKFKAIKHKFGNEKLTDEDIIIISKYRLKYIISKETFCKSFNISDRNFLIRREKKLESNVLKNKLDKLSEYYNSFVYNKKR